MELLRQQNTSNIIKRTKINFEVLGENPNSIRYLNIPIKNICICQNVDSAGDKTVTFVDILNIVSCFIS